MNICLDEIDLYRYISEYTIIFFSLLSYTKTLKCVYNLSKNITAFYVPLSAKLHKFLTGFVCDTCGGRLELRHLDFSIVEITSLPQLQVFKP